MYKNLVAKRGVTRSRKNYGLLAVIFILFATTNYFFYQYKKAVNNPKIEVESLVKDIGSVMLLPKDETPNVATVTDIEKLKDQQFFRNASNGNKVIIYPNSMIAIVYDPVAKLIINVGPIDFPQSNEEN